MNSELIKKTAVKQVRVAADHAGQRLDNFLVRQLKGVPRAAVYRMIRTGQVRINGGRCTPDHKLRAGEEVRIPPVRALQGGTAIVSATVIDQIRNAVIYADANYVVVDKPSGMAVHSGSNLPWGMVDAVRQGRPNQYVELAHRIDRETSGCVVLARNRPALKHIATQFRDGSIVKKYRCLMNGHLREARITVDAPLLKTRGAHEHLVEIDEEGKDAVTEFRLLQTYRECSYVEAELFTGRTHQIRVHAAHIGLPLAGDERYSTPAALKIWKARGLHRLFLHAHQLAFTSLTGEFINCDSPLPAALRAVLDRLDTG
ncbi:MAG: RluA family pseudouridine synthase [Lysobacterales bacterium]